MLRYSLRDCQFEVAVVFSGRSGGGTGRQRDRAATSAWQESLVRPDHPTTSRVLGKVCAHQYDADVTHGNQQHAGAFTVFPPVPLFLPLLFTHVEIRCQI